MTELYQPIAALLDRVASRWRRLVFLRGVARAGLAVTAVAVVVQAVAPWMPRVPLALASLAALALVAAAACGVWALRPAREVPSPSRVARFVEERRTGLDQRLVSAVDVATARDDRPRPAFAMSMVRDAARLAESIDPADIVPSDVLRRAGWRAAGALALLIAVGGAGRSVARQSFDAVALALSPGRIMLEVTPGDARVRAGAPLLIQARLVGNSAPVVANVLRTQSDGAADWSGSEMAVDANGRFTLSLNALESSFRYRVVAGTAASQIYSVVVMRPPKATRIDVEYTYPKNFGLAPRVEEDGGDIYAPAGTDVRLRVHTDVAAASGRVLLGDNHVVELTPDATGTVLAGSLRLIADTSYRLALADAQGLASRGDTEYFIRLMDDRPPEVHLVKPASDRRVTSLQEVEVEAEAADDFGVASLDLVYAVRGRAETIVPLRVPPNQTSVSGAHTLFLEALDLRPGDFISYYVRARDLARGKRPSEARSDIFFLEIKPFEEEFTLAQSQAAMGGGASNPELDDLVVAQKEIIVATWKLDRRSQSANGAQSAQDIRLVGTAENELKARVERASSALRTSTMRDPRARPAGGRGGRPGQPVEPTMRAGQTLSEEDALTAAASAMANAAIELASLKTAAAVAPEMEALNQLLRAQSDVKKREVQRQQAGAGGNTGNRASQDLSSLFDKELARRQETNYETPSGGSKSGDQEATSIDKIKDLARRQDELTRHQQELARQGAQMTPDEVQRELEKLARDQNDLRQRADEIAQQMAAQQDQSSQQPGQQKQTGQTGKSGQQSQGGQQGRSGQAGQLGDPRSQPGQHAGRDQTGQQQPASGKARANDQRMREISEDMRRASSDLRRQDATQASARSERALDKLRDLERQLQNTSPDGQRRALGDLQLEARQLAAAERQIAAESKRSAPGRTGEDIRGRLAGEQERLADRLRSVREGLKQQASPAGPSGREPSGDNMPGTEASVARSLQQAAGEASREIGRERLAERMEQSAQALRALDGQPGSGSGGSALPSVPAADGSPKAQEDIARALDRLADRLAAAGRGRDDESRKITGQLARAQELRVQLEDVTHRLAELQQQRSGQSGSNQPGQQATPQSSQTSPPDSPERGGTSGLGRGGTGGAGAELDQLQAEVNRQLDQVRRLLDETRRDEGSQARGGAGRTFEAQGMTLSAPGTEAFKQDFAKWQELKRQATAALENVESTLSKRLRDKESRDRLTAGEDERAPAAYRQQVDSYFKALASKNKP